MMQPPLHLISSLLKYASLVMYIVYTLNTHAWYAFTQSEPLVLCRPLQKYGKWRRFPLLYQALYNILKIYKTLIPHLGLAGLCERSVNPFIFIRKWWDILNNNIRDRDYQSYSSGNTIPMFKFRFIFNS